MIDKEKLFWEEISVFPESLQMLLKKAYEAHSLREDSLFMVLEAIDGAKHYDAVVKLCQESQISLLTVEEEIATDSFEKSEAKLGAVFLYNKEKDL